jgi:hypothetical protein
MHATIFPFSPRDRAVGKSHSDPKKDKGKKHPSVGNSHARGRRLAAQQEQDRRYIEALRKLGQQFIANVRGVLVSHGDDSPRRRSRAARRRSQERTGQINITG